MSGVDAERAGAWLARDERVLWRRVSEGIVLLPPGAGEPVKLTGPAAMLWELLAEPVRRDEVVAVLAGIHDVEATLAAEAIGSVIVDLAQLGVLKDRG